MVDDSCKCLDEEGGPPFNDDGLSGDPVAASLHTMTFVALASMLPLHHDEELDIGSEKGNARLKIRRYLPWKHNYPLLRYPFTSCSITSFPKLSIWLGIHDCFFQTVH